MKNHYYYELVISLILAEIYILYIVMIKKKGKQFRGKPFLLLNVCSINRKNDIMETFEIGDLIF